MMAVLGVIQHSLQEENPQQEIHQPSTPAIASIVDMPQKVGSPIKNQHIKRILLGVVTYRGQEYCLPSFSATLNNLRCPAGVALDILFVDTSDDEKYVDVLRDRGFTAMLLGHSGSGKRTRIQNIVDGRNMIRNVFLKHQYDALLFVDSDVMLPPDALERLLSHHKEIVIGVYLHNTIINDAQHIMPVVYVFHDKEKGLLRQLRQDEVVEGRLIEAAAGGMGCVLITKSVMEKVHLFHTLSKNSTGGEDAAFYQDASAAGFAIFCDTNVKCLHVPYPVGDERNNYFRFRRKIVEYENTVTFG
ncbi:glycosyltransferase [Candidatus Woesearchaeota archaeon]|nr:glycosyltransferase [Candidatus Woesearchaeota archaeon]